MKSDSGGHRCRLGRERAVAAAVHSPPLVCGSRSVPNVTGAGTTVTQREAKRTRKAWALVSAPPLTLWSCHVRLDGIRISDTGPTCGLRSCSAEIDPARKASQGVGPCEESKFWGRWIQCLESFGFLSNFWGRWIQCLDSLRSLSVRPHGAGLGWNRKNTLATAG